MAYPKSVLDALGLSEDATEEQVLAAISERGQANEPEESAPVEAEKAEEPVEAPKADEALSAGPETVQVSRAVWDEVQADLKHLKAESAARHRKQVMDAALSEGRIVPAEREKWETALSAAPEATETLLSQLPARVSTTETGSDTALSAKDVDGDAVDSYLDNLFAK